MSRRAPNKVEITVSSSYVTPQYAHLPPTTKTIQMPSHHGDQPTPPQQASHPVSSESRASAQTTYRQRSSDILNPSSIAALAYDKPPQNSEEPEKKSSKQHITSKTTSNPNSHTANPASNDKRGTSTSPDPEIQPSPPFPPKPNEPPPLHFQTSRKVHPRKQKAAKKNQQSISLHHAARQPQPLLVPQVQRQHLQRQQNLLFLRSRASSPLSPFCPSSRNKPGELTTNSPALLDLPQLGCSDVADDAGTSP
ncbi:hypothetical protein MGU_02477 [Metarhizium guizhouense ARSEF 977]|uniref:Uncharacterized protein n=1 Tax=Metarhizium guizhouense (strain ARSEF 977) TaxID=1276136 RepID=A0A0B4GT63_METGA|nr:hypothetical protein MGU_02477 [Metarhizium guizhouense ARSEF 977]